MDETGSSENHYYNCDRGNRGGYSGYNGYDDRFSGLTRQIGDVGVGLTAATQAQNLAAIQATNGAAQAAQETATETRSDINRISGDIRLAQSESESRVGSAIERNGGDNRMVTERNGGDTRQAVERTAGETRRDVRDVQTDIHGTIEDRMGELRGVLSSQFTTTLLEIERSKFATIQAKCDLEKQAADNLGRIQLEAAQNKFDIVTKMAECCCEQKELTRAEAAATRQLLQSNEIDRLREKLECSRRESERHQNDNNIRINIENVLRNNNRAVS